MIFVIKGIKYIYSLCINVILSFFLLHILNIFYLLYFVKLYYEIKEGVNLEEEVVVAPYTAISRKLKDKTKVEKTDKEMLTDKDE